ncbi:MAG TPA: Rossmann-like and DUF2520 domain-containing protein [Blastocatellia bacterium]|nr:Rossmann-like and DUF2520 domain-containing protein [Blastocatellia bacterium]
MPQKLTISIIGAGRVGQTLGRLWRDRGYTIESVVCRTKQSARRAVAFIGGGNPHSIDTSDLPASKVFLVSVPDDEIAETAKQIAILRADWSRTVFLHTSGSLSSRILEPLSDCKAHTGSAHPLLSISSPKLGVSQIAGGYFCIEGDKEATSLAKRLVKSIGGKTFEIDSSDKALYHAAAVLASPHLTALLSLSIQALEQCGVSKTEAHKILQPLVNSTIENLWKHGAETALTGPVSRADIATIRRNLRALAQTSELAENVYRFLSLQGANLSRSAGAPQEKLEPIIHELLQNPWRQSR